MELVLKRKWFSGVSTIGELYADGQMLCETLEDTVRAEGYKLMGKTAIPEGTYRLVVDYSDAFRAMMPHVLNVKGFEGIRIHRGNSAEHTEGCILVGRRGGPDAVYDSALAYANLCRKLAKALEKKEDITLTVRNVRTREDVPAGGRRVNELSETWRWLLGIGPPGAFSLVAWRFSQGDKAREQDGKDAEDRDNRIRADFKEAMEAQAKFFTESIKADRLFLQTLLTGQQAQWEAGLQSLREQNENVRLEVGAMRTRLHADAKDTNQWRADHMAKDNERWEGRDKSSAEYREKTSATLADHAGTLRLLEERTDRLAQDVREKIDKLGGNGK